MSSSYQPPYAVFTGALGDLATGQYIPAQAEVGNGVITLWVATPAGWTQYFSVPAYEVVVKSAAQRITLVVRGHSYPLLADPRAVDRAMRYAVAGGLADILDKPRFEMGVDVGRGISVAGAAHSFHLSGGPAFVDAARQSGARASRLGYGPILAIGCGAGLLVVVAVTVITVFILVV